MNSPVSAKTYQVNKILKLLNSSRTSSESCGEPERFVIGHKQIPELPESINRNFKLLHEIIGNPEKELYINEWIILSTNDVVKQYKTYCEEGQNNIVNLAYRYLGLGHVEVLSCNLYNHLLFLRRDGGSNDWDRKANHNEIVNFNYRKYDYFYFTKWYKDLHLN